VLGEEISTSNIVSYTALRMGRLWRASVID
jgi:hypothetical protein